MQIFLWRLERINGEFRRRTKTQASLPGEEAVLFLVIRIITQRPDRPAPHRWAP
jgi:transposase-like protein